MPTTSTAPALATDWARVLALRMTRQGLTERAAGPEELASVVGRLVGLHAQVMSSAELQAAARIDGLRVDDVRDALWDQRTLVKVWAFRQTLHLLTVDDLAEFVLAARSLERWHTPVWLRYFKMTESQVSEVIDAIGDALSDRPMTRIEVVDSVVERVRRPHLRQAMLTGWGTFMGPAAQRGKLVFGPSNGRNVAFVEPSDWLGRAIKPTDDPDAQDRALARLIGRYLAVFPGASRKMIARWWGGGRMAGVNRALKHLEAAVAEIDVEGARGLILREDVAALATASADHELRLLPSFDPFTNELPRRVDTVLGDANHDRVHRTAGWVTPIVMVDGRVGGTWEIENGRGRAGTVVVQPFARWRGGARRELAAEVDRIAVFFDRPLRNEILSIAR